MSVEVRPLGVNCNMGCLYCYQNPIKDAGNTTTNYDMDAIARAVHLENSPFALFGGEPLLVPVSDLEKLFELGFRLHGKNSIQTNASLIGKEHIDLFKKYNVSVGVSMDGPKELNDTRWMGSLDKTRMATDNSENAIDLMVENDIPVSLILTIHKNNASAEKIERLKEWIKSLAHRGVQHIRIHLLEVESNVVREKLSLTPDENFQALQSLYQLEKELPGDFLNVYGDLRNLLNGTDSNVPCVWRACDPYTTQAVRGIEGNGKRTNCGRTNKDGIEYSKARLQGYERYIMLYHTPQEYGGCKGCRFFLFCKGQCPGSSINGDWRNRSEHCLTWKLMFEFCEKEMILEEKEPLSLSKDLGTLEEIMVENWGQGQNPDIQKLLQHYTPQKNQPNKDYGTV